jgi:hypothetical protein
MTESLECDEPADADDARHGIVGHRNWNRKPFEIDSVVNTVNFLHGIGTTLAEQIPAVIGFSGNKLRSVADFAKEIIAGKVLHEVLSVRRDAERNP